MARRRHAAPRREVTALPVATSSRRTALAKGDEMGALQHGLDRILLFAARRSAVGPVAGRGSTVRMGERIGTRDWHDR